MAATSRGFLRPTTTPTPDEIFDVWLSELTGSELKVLLYIVRRTFGFKDEVRRSVAKLHEILNRYPRPASLGEIEIGIAVRPPIDEKTVSGFAELGVRRIVLIPSRELDTAALERLIAMIGDLCIG
jgi:hypothetical protein